MSSQTTNTKKLTFMPLVLMIFTSVFGFANMPRSFYLMGYAAIPWYILSAITFFIPFAYMVSEYGAAFKNESGGIYSWMSKSMNPKYAFVATFMWYASYLIWMVNVSSGLWVVLSNAIFGSDVTSTWSLFGLSSTQTLGILACLWILFVTFVSSKGLNKITKITSLGGTAVALLNVVLIVGALIVLIGNGGQLAEPIMANGQNGFFHSPSPNYQSPIAVFSFLVFAIFAFGGVEVTGGLVDQTENAEKTFPKGVKTSAIVISIGYTIGIFCVGVFTNWESFLSGDNIHMGNAAYAIMNNLGVQLGQVFGMSASAAATLGDWIARFVGLSMLLALSGAFFTLTYSPLKQLIQGTPKELWPGKLAKIEDGMPKYAMKIQAIVVIVMILLVSFGGDAMAAFFNKLVLMTNVAMTIPYMFISGAFYSFKKKDEIEKPFVIYKTLKGSKIAAIMVTFVVGFANFFTIIQPAVDGDISSTIWSIAGPLFFTLVALVMYNRYEKNHLSNIRKAA